MSTLNSPTAYSNFVKQGQLVDLKYKDFGTIQNASDYLAVLNNLKPERNRELFEQFRTGIISVPVLLLSRKNKIRWILQNEDTLMYMTKKLRKRNIKVCSVEIP